jgi:hypothetical protein
MRVVKFLKTDEEKLVTDKQAELYLEMKIIEPEKELEETDVLDDNEDIPNI